MKQVEDALQKRSSVRRIVELDSLRGLAACVVILCHLIAPIGFGPQWYLRPIFDGHVSVVLFFVLSGHVLSLPFWQGKQLTYTRYLIRRFFRLYVPYAVAVCFALLVGKHLIGSQLPLTSWFYVTWHTPFTASLIASQFLAIDTAGKINIAFWSLRYEMEMSMMMPLICACLRMLTTKRALSLALGIEMAGFAGFHLFENGGFWLEVSKTLAWGSCFLFGALLAKEKDAIARRYTALSIASRLILVACTVAIFYCGHDELSILGACGVIILAQNSSVTDWLRQPLPEYLGRISYSLYLVITLVVSHLFCVSIEEPAMRLGKRLAASSRPRSPRIAVPLA